MSEAWGTLHIEVRDDENQILVLVLVVVGFVWTAVV
jgi:hypothetical protein